MNNGSKLVHDKCLCVAAAVIVVVATVAGLPDPSAHSTALGARKPRRHLPAGRDVPSRGTCCPRVDVRIAWHVVVATVRRRAWEEGPRTVLLDVISAGYHHP